MNCPGCGSTHVSVEFDENGLINACVECERRWKAHDLPRDDAAPPESVRTSPKRAPLVTQRKTTNPKTLIQQAKARVAELDREIKRLTRLVQERDELKRLLLAAKPSGEAANVRPLRAASRG